MPLIIAQAEQKQAPFIQTESPLGPKKEGSHRGEPLPSVTAEAKGTSEQKPTILLQQPEFPLESKKEDIQAQASPAPLTAEAKATRKTEIPTKIQRSRYLIRTPIKEHWNYYLIIALLIISVILFALYFTIG